MQRKSVVFLLLPSFSPSEKPIARDSESSQLSAIEWIRFPSQSQDIVGQQSCSERGLKTLSRS